MPSVELDAHAVDRVVEAQVRLGPGPCGDRDARGPHLRNGFKQIHDRWGHERGDEVLVLVAQRLGFLARPGDTVARMGGDEFVIVCPDLHGADELGPITTRYSDALAKPLMLASGEQVSGVSASIGTAVSGIDSTPESLIRTADHTMHAATRRGARDRLDQAG